MITRYAKARYDGRSLPRFCRGAPQIEVRFQVRELLDGALALTFYILVHEAKGEELVRAVVMLGVPHGGLLGHADYVAGGDDASVGEFEVF